MSENNKSPASKALKDIYDTVRQLHTLLKVFQIDINENTELLKQLVNNGNNQGNISRSQFYKIVQHYKIRDLTPRQLYFLLKDTGDAEFICAISGLSREEASKKIEGFKIKNQ